MGAIRRYLLKRAVETVITLLVVLVLSFYLFRIMPGDPVRLMFRGSTLSAQDLQKLTQEFNLNAPLWVQFLSYLQNTFQGNLGISFYYREPVLDVLIPKLENTLILLIPATILASIFGVFLGVISAWRRGKKTDVSSVVSSFVFYAMPVFWLSILVLLIDVNLKILPTAGIVSSGVPSNDPIAYVLDVGKHLILPTLTLTLSLLAQFVLVMRNSMLGVLGEDYMVTAWAKGAKGRRLYWTHGARNAILPTVTLVALNIGFLFGGAVQTETVFTYPGLGLLTYNALLERDFPILQGTFLLLALAVILSNLVADIIYAYLDPRIRYGGK